MVKLFVFSVGFYIFAQILYKIAEKMNKIGFLFMLLGVLFCPDGVSMCWVATAIGAGLGVLSSLYGGAKASEASRRANAELARQEREEKAWYERAYNQRYADTAAGQALMSRAREFARSNWKKAEGTNRVAGGTDASVAKAKEQGNAMVGNTLQQIAANDTARKDNIDMAHRNRLKELSMARAGVETQRAQNITAAASQASNALMSAGATFDSGRKGDSSGNSPLGAAPKPTSGAVNNNDGSSNLKGFFDDIVDKPAGKWELYDQKPDWA